MQIEELKDKLYHSIQKYGLTDTRTVEVSEMLDISIILEQRRINNVDFKSEKR